MVWVVSLSAQDPVATRIVSSLKPFVGNRGVTATTFDASDRAVPEGPLTFVIVVLSPSPDRGLEFLRQIRAGFTGPLLAVGKATEAKLILRALQSGANHYLDQADLESQLEAALGQFLFKQEGDALAGRLLCALAVSGGCGASTVAANVAAALAAERGRCCLIDLNPGRGDLSALLDLKPAFTLADVCQNEARLDRGMLDKMLVRHTTGIHLLASPPNFADARDLSARATVKALNLARRSFPDVVVDVEDCFHEEQEATLQQATGIFVLCRLEFTSLRNARRTLDHLKRISIPRHRLKLVVNQSGQPNELPVDEAEEALGEKLTRFIPYDPKTVLAANNTGVPAVIKSPQAKVSQSLIQLSRTSFDKEAASCILSPRPVLPKVNHSTT